MSGAGVGGRMGRGRIERVGRRGWGLVGGWWDDVDRDELEDVGFWTRGFHPS